MNPSFAPVNLLYIVLAVLTVGFGVVIVVVQTAASRRALSQRRGMLFAGVLLVLVGGGVLLVQGLTLFKAMTGTA